MSGARSAIDVMTAEDTALLDSMRNDTEAPETEVVAAPDPEPEQDLDDAPEAEESAAATPEPGAEPKPLSRTAKRIQEMTEKVRKAEEGRVAAEQARAVSEGVVAERLRLLTEAAQSALQPPAPQAPPPIEIPDINTDPVGHFKARFEQSERQAAEQAAILQGFNQQQQQQLALAELRAWGSRQESEFSAREPAYADAMRFMIGRRKAQLVALKVPESRQQEVIAGDITQIAMKARSEGSNFAEQMWDVAASYGFQKKEPEPAVPVIPPLSAGLPAADRAARAETGRANATTIANVGASTPVGLSVDRLANMPQKEWERYYNSIKDDPTKLRDMMGH